MIYIFQGKDGDDPGLIPCVTQTSGSKASSQCHQRELVSNVRANTSGNPWIFWENDPEMADVHAFYVNLLEGVQII